MARARNIKPGFFTNDDLAEVDALGRILFIGLWCVADREGRLVDRPKKIKAEILPYDDCDANELLDQLVTHGFVARYSVGGASYIQIINFHKHQDPHYKEKASEIPAPEGHTDSGKTAGGVAESVRLAVFERDGNTCLACGSGEDLSLDHIIPRSKGGSHDESNLQTLCRRCNSAKNNRQAKSDIDQSSANDRPMIGESFPGQSPLIPDSPSLIPESNTTNPIGLVAASDADAPPAKPAKPDCPHQQIIALYHELLPTSPEIRDWTPARAIHLRTRWNETPERQNLDWWERFFGYIAKSDFLTGKSHSRDRKPFCAPLDWICKAENFAKIVEGRYHEDAAA